MHKRMRVFRHRAKLTLPELSRLSGVGTNTIANWELGGGMTTLANVAAVCDVLGISIDEYIGRDVPDPMKRYEKEINMLIEHAERILAICEELKGDKK